MDFSGIHGEIERAKTLLAEGKHEQAIRHYQTTLNTFNNELSAEFEQGTAIETLVHSRSQLIDQILISLWQVCFDQANQLLALVAVGGYGRGEMHPYSDVDLLILTADPDYSQSANEQFIALLWDLGLEIGHSVRTIDDCASQAADNVTIVTSLLESRLLAGSNHLYDGMRQAISESRIWSKKDFFRAKLAEQENRHQKFHETAYRLEPNLKEGPGGLRDIQTIAWVTKRYFNAKTLEDLETLGFLTMDELASLKSGREHLWRIRFALHTLAKRCEDRLLFDSQRELAQQFGFHDKENTLAVEQFMQQYYKTVTQLERLNEMLLQLLQEAIEYSGDKSEPIIINERFHAKFGYLEARHSTVFKQHPPALLEAFLLMMQHPELKGVRANTIRLIREHKYLITDEFRQDPVNRKRFMDMLKEKVGVSHELRRMNRYGILAAYIPAFANVVGRMQYDLFHIYTVDLHTLFVIRNIRRFSVEKHRHWQPLCHKIFPALRHPENLYIAALFHDIAKGRGGDHSELGALDVAEFCQAHGMNEGNTNIVTWLVRNHLLMSTTAQHKDIYDPAVIHEFSTQVGDIETLDYLYLLTIADISATNPELLTSWKEQLLRELYDQARQMLQQGLAEPIDLDARIKERQNNAHNILATDHISPNQYHSIWEDFGKDYFLQHSADEIAWHTRAILSTNPNDLPLVLIQKNNKRGSSSIFIYARENDGFFAITSNTLSKLGLNVMDARIITSKSGFTLDTYIVLEQDNKPIEEDFRAHEIKFKLSQSILKTDAIKQIKRRSLPRQLQSFTTETQISFNQNLKNRYTILRVHTLDRPGLLAHTGQALYECNVRIHTAKITTLGEMADNIFMITDESNAPINNQNMQAKIKQELLIHIDGKSANNKPH